MTTLKFITTYWNLDIIAIVIAIALIVFHFITNGNTFNKKSLLFLSGVTLYIIATCSALNYLADYYLYSAHMVKDIIILLIVPPMLLSSTNPDFLKKIVNRPGFDKIGKILFHPLVAWILGVGSMWLWNFPDIFYLLEDSPWLKLLQMISLLIFGLIFIYPVFAPIKYHKLHPLQSAIYLFTACVGCTIMGIMITFAPAFIYTPYFAGPVFWCCGIQTAGPAASIYAAGSNAAISNLIQSNWGISAKIDQQMAGLIMWIPACFVYLTNIMISLTKWYAKSGSETYTRKNVLKEKLNLS